MELYTLGAFALYFAILISIGLFASHKSRNATGYFLGNRSLNYWVTAISAHASDMSVWLFMGVPMVIYTEGLIHIWTCIGLVVFMFCNWHFIAPRLRLGTEQYQSLTLFSFFEARLKDDSKMIRITCAGISTLFLTIYIASGVTGLGYLLESLFHINYHVGCTLGVVGILIYTWMGGFTAIAWTDFFQGTFLLVVILLVPFLALTSDPDAWATIINKETLKNATGFWPTDGATAFKAFVLAFGWGVGYFGQPHILNKFMAIAHPNELYKSKWLGTSWQILALGGAVVSGLAALSYFKAPLPNNELVFVEMVNGLFPAFLGAFLLCAILAATLSTIDAQMLVLASVVTEDLYVPFQKEASQKRQLFVSRLCILFIGLSALVIAAFKPSSIFNLVYYCWVGMGAAFGPLVICCLYIPWITRKAALYGVIVGGIIGAFWIGLDTAISATLPGFVFGFLVIILGSYWENKRTIKHKIKV